MDEKTHGMKGQELKKALQASTSHTKGSEHPDLIPFEVRMKSLFALVRTSPENPLFAELLPFLEPEQALNQSLEQKNTLCMNQVFDSIERYDANSFAQALTDLELVQSETRSAFYTSAWDQLPPRSQERLKTHMRNKILPGMTYGKTDWLQLASTHPEVVELIMQQGRDKFSRSAPDSAI